jgi:glycosyltransferase involved in cell wall biosynthesis
MTMEDLVSVIIPAYNRPALVPRAIRSVLDQSYRNLEVLVVDDGSDDDLGCIVSAFQDPRLRFIRHQVNRGVAAAFNTGIEASRGRYLSFLGSDDEWHRRKVEVLLEEMVRSNRSETVVYCLNEVYVDQESRAKTGSDFCENGDILHHALARCCIGLNQMLVRKDQVMAAGGMDERFRMHSDWDLLIRLARRCHFTCVDEVLVRDHIHQYSRITTDWGESAQYLRMLYSRHKNLFQKDRAARSRFFEWVAFCHYQAGARVAAIEAQMQSLIFAPLRSGAYVRLALLATGRIGVDWTGSI